MGIESQGKAFMSTHVFLTAGDSQAGLHHFVNMHSQTCLQVKFYSKTVNAYLIIYSHSY